MKTRSQTQKQEQHLYQEQHLQQEKHLQKEQHLQQEQQQRQFQLYEVNIDFDEASRVWRSNKKPVSNGCYKYICSVVKKDVKCGRMCYKNLEYCWQHRQFTN